MGNKPLLISDVCKENKCNENDFHINTTDFFSSDYRDVLASNTPLSYGSVDVTVMDLLNIPITSDEGICDLIKKRFHIDLDTKEGIERINDLFQDTKERYTRRYFQRLPMKIEKLVFKNKQTVINFIKETKLNKRTGYINCALAKFAYAVDDVLSNEKVRREHFLDEKFISTYLERPFQIEEGYEDKNENIYRIGKVVINDKIIKFKIISRQKGVDSIIGKQLSDPKYYSTDEFFDLVGATIYVDHDYEGALVMQYIDQMVYIGNAKIDNKNGLDINAVKKEVFLNKEFYIKLEIETKKVKPISDDEEEFQEIQKATSSKKKEATATSYREIKLVGVVDLPFGESTKSSMKPVGAEVKVVVGGHDNEKGLALQTIYEYMKRFRELTRMGIPIRKLDIVNYVNDFFDNIEDSLKKKNKEQTSYYQELYTDLVGGGYINCEEKQAETQGDEKEKAKGKDILALTQANEKILAIGLYKYFLSKLKKVKIGNTKSTFYVDKRMLDLRDAGLYRHDLHEVE